MENQVNNVKAIRKRRFLIVLPLLVLPFITIIFFVFGGGSVSDPDPSTTGHIGFNMQLPGGKLDAAQSSDKLAFYNKATADSAKLLEQMKKDPGYENVNGENLQAYYSGGLNTSVYAGQGRNDPATEGIYSKLSELNRELNRSQSATSQYQYDYNRNGSPGRSAGMGSGDIDRLEQMMQMMNRPQEEDPEMKQLNGMIENILDLQNPGRVREKLKQSEEARRGQVFAVNNKSKSEVVTLLESKQSITDQEDSGFYTLNNYSFAKQVQNAIQAVVHETQTLTTGSTVKLRLINEIVVNNITIPKDNFLFGVASLNGERLEIKITTIRYGNAIYPVDLTLFDLDGLNGIHIPDAVTRAVAKQSADQTMQGLSLGGLDPSWGAQAAGAGIEVVKSMVGRKVKLVKVTIKAGYKILLQDEKQKENAMQIPNY